MKPTLLPRTLLLTALLTSSATAAIEPSFQLPGCTWLATDIIIGEQTPAEQGKITVTEIWKGDLKKGASIQVNGIPPVPMNASEEYGFPKGIHIDGKRVLLFLVHKDDKWIGVDSYGGAKTSAVWFQNNTAYAFQQIFNPGATVWSRLEESEAQLKTATLTITADRIALTKALAISAKSDRAAALAPLAQNTKYWSNDEAFKALGDCGDDAIPLLQKMIHSPAHDQGRVAYALGTALAKSPSAGPILTAILNEEADYWKKTAPTLTPGWWNQDPATRRNELRERYSLLTPLLTTLIAHPHPEIAPAISNLQSTWTNSPALNNKDLNTIITQCKKILTQKQNP